MPLKSPSHRRLIQQSQPQHFLLGNDRLLKNATMDAMGKAQPRITSLLPKVMKYTNMFASVVPLNSSTSFPAGGTELNVRTFASPQQFALEQPDVDQHHCVDSVEAFERRRQSHRR